MDLSMENDEDHLNNLAGDDANNDALYPEAIWEIDMNIDMLNPEVIGEVTLMGDEFPADLHSLGARLRNIGVTAAFSETFDVSQRPRDSEPAAPIVLFLLYPELRQGIVKELRDWIVVSGCFEMRRVENMFRALGRLDVEEIEQEYGEALLEFVDELGSLMVKARRQSQRSLFGPMLHNIAYPLHAPLGPIVAAKLLQYAQSVEPIKSLTLSCGRQHRVFRPDEVEQLVRSILNLKQLTLLDLQVDVTGFLLVKLCARLQDHDNLSKFYISGVSEDAPQDLPNESHVIRNIRQLSSLKSLHLSFVILGESTVNLFSATESAYTKLKLDRCRFLIGDKGEGTEPSELPLAVALASNTRLVELSLQSVHGSGVFFEGIEQGLLRNRTLRTLFVSNRNSRANQRIPEFAYFGWIQSIRLHPSLRRLVLDMCTWSGRVADAVCSVVRENTSLRSIELFREAFFLQNDNEIDPEWVAAVLQSLQANRTIVDVRIRVGSDFGEPNWTRLANESIENINLDAGNESIPERVIELLQRVKSNRTLKHLGLKNAVFGRQHTSVLVALLADNYVLVSLVYEDHEPHDGVQRQRHDPIFCSDKGSESLLKGILDLNYDGRKYMRTEPNSVVYGVSLLSHVSSNLDAVYFHLRENPRLCDRREWKPIVAVRHFNAVPCGSDRCDRKRRRHSLERRADR